MAVSRVLINPIVVIIRQFFVRSFVWRVYFDLNVLLPTSLMSWRSWEVFRVKQNIGRKTVAHVEDQRVGLRWGLNHGHRLPTERTSNICHPPHTHLKFVSSQLWLINVSLVHSLGDSKRRTRHCCPSRVCQTCGNHGDKPPPALIKNPIL